jgi:hypothetical protein
VSSSFVPPAAADPRREDGSSGRVPPSDPRNHSDPVAVLGIGDEPSLADALRALGARYDEQAERLLGAGEDLLVTALSEDSDADPLALREALTPRIRPLLEAAAAVEILAAQPGLDTGEMPRLRDAGGDGEASDLDLAEPAWPVHPPGEVIRARLASWARRRTLVPDDLFNGELELSDASAARLVVTRIVEEVTETRMWTPAERLTLKEFSGEPAKAAGEHRGWEETRWEGVREGSVRPRTCTGCGGDGRLPCPRCTGSMFEQCQPFEPCRICQGTGRRPRARGEPARPVCEVCNGRGMVPCPSCGGMGRRPCGGCGDGHVGCKRCRGYGRLTEYMHAVVERRSDAEQVEIGGAARLDGVADHYRHLATLTRYRAIPGMPDDVGEALRVVFEERQPGQIRQRVEVSVLPAVHIGFRDRGLRRSAWLVGDDGEVRVPRRRWPRLPFGLVMAVGTIALAFMLVGRLRG